VAWLLGFFRNQRFKMVAKKEVCGGEKLRLFLVVIFTVYIVKSDGE